MLLLLAVMAAVVWIVAFQLWPRPLEVVSFAVGKGDAFLIRSPNGRTVMIDGGSSEIPDVGNRILVPNLLLLGVRKLDAIIITHPDSDHYNGLSAVIKSLPVRMVLDPQMPCDNTPYLQLVATIRERKIPYFPLRAGACINFSPTCRLSVLAPARTGLPARVPSPTITVWSVCCSTGMPACCSPAICRQRAKTPCCGNRSTCMPTC